MDNKKLDRFAAYATPLIKPTGLIMLVIVGSVILVSPFAAGPLSDLLPGQVILLHLFVNGAFLLLVGSGQGDGKISKTPWANLLSLLLVVTPLWGLALINVILAGQALFSFDAGKLWILLFLIPAGLSGLLAGRRHEANERGVREHQNRAPAKQEEEPTGSPLGILWAYVLIGRNTAAYMIALILILGFGGAYYALVRTALFSQPDLPLSIVTNIAPNVLEAIAPHLIVAPVVLGGMMVLLGIGYALAQTLMLRRHPDADRNFSHKEIKYLEEAEHTLSEYLKVQNFPGTFPWLYNGGGFICLLIGMLIFGGGTYWLAAYLSGLFEANRIVPGESIYVSDAGFGAASIVGIFTGLLFPLALYQKLGTCFERFSIYMYKSGWASLNGQTRSEADYSHSIAKLLRTGAVKIDEPFDPGAILRLLFMRTRGLSYGLFAAFFALMLVFLIPDIRWYTLVTDSRIQYSEYFSGEVHTFSYTDIEHVELGCYTYLDDGDRRLSLDYVLKLPTGKTISLLDTNVSDKELRTVQNVDTLLAKSDPVYQRRDTFGLPFMKKPAFVENCEALILEKYGTEKGGELAKLLQLRPRS